MYIPDKFDYGNDRRLIDLFVDEYFFGQIISFSGNESDLSYSPVEYEASLNELIFHLAADNPHCESIENGVEQSCIFNGPSSYVSPAFYINNSVPTWNYLSVIFSGPVTRVDDKEQAINHLSRLTEYFENENESSWDISSLGDRLEIVLDKIRVYRLSIAGTTAKFKMSQNKTMDDRASVEKELRKKGKVDVADVMRLIRESEL